MNAKFYTYKVFWSEEDQEFVGLCAEFPGLSWLEDNQVAALSGIVAAAQACLDDLVSSNEPIPAPLPRKEQYDGHSVA